MRIGLALLAVLIALPVFGQGIQLTPEQKMMLNQLPPAQREQALQVLRQQTVVSSVHRG